ncbi:uncharacterized protein LOC134719750 [Mytilus trossulus]|uniref:uncharacterized protein LOC134719750 n=1 Tax=Mytilus trossulus TaxID=6551 RepID=UPI0030073955
MPRGKTPNGPLPASEASNGSLVSIESRELPYFYSNFSNTDEVADYLLHKSKSKVGVFLVRPSFKNRSMLTVSVVVADKTVRHTNIVIEGTGALKKYYLVKEKKFDSVDELIRYYYDHDVKNLQKVTHVRFLYPLTPSNYQQSRSSSGGSYHTINSQGSGGGRSACVGGNDERPPLPERNHVRRGSQESFNSQMSVFTDTGSMSSGTPLFHSNSGPIPIPKGASSNSINKDGSFHSNWTLGPSGGSFPHLPSPTLPSPTDDIAKRPPPPIPQIPQSDVNPYYSEARNVDKSIKEELKKVIRDSERCDCGIPRDISDLPLGWTVHRSKDAATYGRVFFQNEAGVTSWKLPEDVNRKLTAQHQTNLKKLKVMKFDDDYLESNIPPDFLPRSPSNRSNGSGIGSDGKRFSNTQF